MDPTAVMGDEDRQRAAALSVQPLRPPAPVPGLVPERFLGVGAFGEVWVARDRNTGCRVALKFFTHRSGVDWSLLAREVEKLRFLKTDRYVVQLLQVGWDAEPPYYVMEYLEAGSLEEHLERNPLSAAEAVELFREVALGLRHAHAKGILHCDLKPANILLDQDRKPRLADFGQARLTNEQSPALGTLFYMAPEQATLQGVPDARWDVYALGAVLYRMLTGQPPYRGEPGASEIQKGPTLKDRLERYRQFILRAARPTGHRQVPGVDRALAEIVDRCLAVKPEARFPNVQAVLDAVDHRALRRARRPLLALAVVGPALFLAVLGPFAYEEFKTTIEETKKTLRQDSLKANQLAAEYAAELVARRVSQRWEILEREAASDDLVRRIQQALPARTEAPTRQPLLDKLEWLRREYRPTTNAQGWFVLGSRGKLLAMSPLKEEYKPYLGKDFSHRRYFHGGVQDLPPRKEQAGPSPPPTDHPVVSGVLKNTLDGQLTVVFAVPVKHGDERLGVLGLSVLFNDYSDVVPAPVGSQAAAVGGEDRPGPQAVLVETTPGFDGQRGLILHHPFLEQLREAKKAIAQQYYVHVREDLLDRLQGDCCLPSSAGSDHHYYRDPFGEIDPGQYGGDWLAAAQPVQARTPDGKPVPTDWTVIVQERARDVYAPAVTLKRQLLQKGLWALGLTVGLLAGLWWFVLVVLNDSSRSRLARYLRRRAGVATAHASSLTGTATGTGASERSTGIPSADEAPPAAAAPCGPPAPAGAADPSGPVRAGA